MFGSTISDNGANNGAGIENRGTLTLTNVTLRQNAASLNGGGIYNFGGTIGLTNTIIAENIAPRGPDCTGSPTSLGHNLIGTSDGCSFTPNTGDMVNVDPMLGPLQGNGGPTSTHALLPRSPAIDAGDDSVLGAPHFLTGDQRGAGFPRKSGAHVDIGAYEVQPACSLPREMIKGKWNLTGWACDQPGDPARIGLLLSGLVRILEWDATSQGYTRSYRSNRPFNTLTSLAKWYAYWLYYEP